MPISKARDRERKRAQRGAALALQARADRRERVAFELVEQRWEEAHPPKWLDILKGGATVEETIRFMAAIGEPLTTEKAAWLRSLDAPQSPTA